MAAAYTNIFEYTDYRKFLADYQKQRVIKDKSFTKTAICRKLGLPNTRSFFNDVLSRRTLSRNYIERFIQVLELEPEEARYFRVLVLFNQSLHEQEREQLFDQLITLNRTPRKFVDKKSFAFYMEWQHSAIRALLDTVDFHNDYKNLGARLRPRISPKKARESIQLLSKLGLIKKNGQGCWKPTDKVITTRPYVQDQLVKQYQLKCIEMGKTALLNQSEQLNNFSTLTLSLSGQTLQKIEEKIQNFKAEIRSLVHKDPKKSEKVYQLNLQFYPQSE